MTKVQAINFLKNEPYKFGHLVGFDKLTSMHNGWMKQMLLGEDDMTLQAHRGSYKTTCVSVMLAIMMILLPRMRILFVRKTDDDVKEIIKQVRKILLTQQMQYFVHTIYEVDLRLTVDNATELSTNLSMDTKGTSQLMAMGIGGSITGKHFDRIFTDDIVNLKDRKSKAEREHTKEVYQELQNIKNPKGRIVNTGTPWHIEDAFVLMPEAQKFDCYTTEMLTDEQIAELRRSMAPSLFAANYELQHIASENALFTKAPEFFSDPLKLKDGVCHIDAAYGGEDYTAFTCCKKIGDKLYMYGRLWNKHVDTVIDVCIAEAKNLMCAPVHCETNADKGFLAREIVKRGLPAKTYAEKENKYVKISTFLRKWWEDIVWLEGTDKAYLNQIMDYTEDAEHDDAPDSAACMCRIFDRRSGENYVSPFGR